MISSNKIDQRLLVRDNSVFKDKEAINRHVLYAYRFDLGYIYGLADEFITFDKNSRELYIGNCEPILLPKNIKRLEGVLKYIDNHLEDIEWAIRKNPVACKTLKYSRHIMFRWKQNREILENLYGINALVYTPNEELMFNFDTSYHLYCMNLYYGFDMESEVYDEELDYLLDRLLDPEVIEEYKLWYIAYCMFNRNKKLYQWFMKDNSEFKIDNGNLIIYGDKIDEKGKVIPFDESVNKEELEDALELMLG